MWRRETSANLANCELFAKFSLPIFTDTLKMYLAHPLTLALFILPVVYSYMVCQKISLTKIFPCTVLMLFED